jgi:hypothetical protein
VFCVCLSLETIEHYFLIAHFIFDCFCALGDVSKKLRKVYSILCVCGGEVFQNCFPRTSELFSWGDGSTRVRVLLLSVDYRKQHRRQRHKNIVSLHVAKHLFAFLLHALKLYRINDELRQNAVRVICCFTR